MEDIRNLDLDSDLVPQISALVLDRIEDLIHALFSGADPKINISFHIVLDFGLGRIDETIHLGDVRLPLNSLINVVRNAIGELALFENSVRIVAARVRAALEAAGQLHAAQTRKQTADEEHRRVTRELENSNRAGFGIEVVSPTAAGFYEGSTVEVEIFLKNVPLSFLGLGDLEHHRVTIFLNHDELLTTAFVVEEHQGPAIAQTSPIRFAGQADVGGIDAADFRPPQARPAALGPILRYQPGIPVGPWGQTVVVEPTGLHPQQRLELFRQQQGRTVAPPPGPAEQAVLQARSAKNAPRPSRPQSPAAARVGQAIGKQVRDPLGGRQPSTPANVPSLGRTLPVRQRLDHIGSLGPGLLLRLQLPAARFKTGPNALAVSIIPGRGPRLEQSVSFAVFAGAPASPPKIPPVPRTGAELPLPDALRAFSGGKGFPRLDERKPMPPPKAWIPPKKERAAAVRESIAAQKKRSKMTIRDLSARLASLRGRSASES